MQAERVRAIRRAGREDARQCSRLVVTRMHLEDAPIRLVQPRHQDELISRADPLERFREGRLQEDPRVGRSSLP
jgi:hypothetical protein